MIRPRVKLLTLWSGPLPSWYGGFLARLKMNPIIDWELVDIDGVDGVNRLASLAAGVPSCKATPYSLCDLRPLFGQMFFGALYEGYEWWGWCDLDVVFGDLERLLPPLMECHDIIGVEANAISGPLTILRNTPEIRNLYRKGDYKEVLKDPDYCNFDEDGFSHPDVPNGNPSFTRIVKASGLRYRFDGRSWAESHAPLSGGAPSRCCDLKRGRLFEIPTGRELLLYHFTAEPKRWPLPNRYGELIGEQMERTRARGLPHPDVPTVVPEESPAYWSRRLAQVLADGSPIHMATMDTSQEAWDAYQAWTSATLVRYVREGENVLDAGCGYGALAPIIRGLGANYLGVDYCGEMVEEARKLHPTGTFLVADVSDLPLPDDHFDIAVCRAVEGSTRTLVSNRKWRAMQTEMLRVARRVVVMDSARKYRVIER